MNAALAYTGLFAPMIAHILQCAETLGVRTRMLDRGA